MKPSLPIVLGLNGGYVDAAGYLALHGLFTTHVTGNFVTLGAAALIYAKQGIWCFAIPPLLAACSLWLGESAPEAR